MFFFFKGYINLDFSCFLFLKMSSYYLNETCLVLTHVWFIQYECDIFLLLKVAIQLIVFKHHLFFLICSNVHFSIYS